MLATARVAGIMAAKQTPSLIPLCHPLSLTSVTVSVELVESLQRYGAIKVTATVECHGPTGVEMEALTAVTGACLTVVDMCKAVDRGVSIDGVRVLTKSGGRTGDWSADDPPI